jgi:hypothetical protein
MRFSTDYSISCRVRIAMPWRMLKRAILGWVEISDESTFTITYRVWIPGPRCLNSSRFCQYYCHEMNVDRLSLVI